MLVCLKRLVSPVAAVVRNPYFSSACSMRRSPRASAPNAIEAQQVLQLPVVALQQQKTPSRNPGLQLSESYVVKICSQFSLPILDNKKTHLTTKRREKVSSEPMDRTRRKLLRRVRHAGVANAVITSVEGVRNVSSISFGDSNVSRYARIVSLCVYSRKISFPPSPLGAWCLASKYV